MCLLFKGLHPQTHTHTHTGDSLIKRPEILLLSILDLLPFISHSPACARPDDGARARARDLSPNATVATNCGQACCPLSQPLTDSFYTFKLIFCCQIDFIHCKLMTSFSYFFATQGYSRTPTHTHIYT